MHQLDLGEAILNANQRLKRIVEIDLNPLTNNTGLPDFFKQHLKTRIVERGGYYGMTWNLIRRYREETYCLAKKADRKLGTKNAKVLSDSPRGRCG
jgi:hypothetical protein